MRGSTVMGLQPGPGTRRSAPFLVYIGFLMLGGFLAPLLADPRWLYGIQVALVSLALAAMAANYSELSNAQAVTVSEWLLAVCVGIGVFVLWVNLDQSWATLGESRGFDPRDDKGLINWPLASVRLFGAAVVVPVMEELFWRSFIQRWIDAHDFLSVTPRRMSLRALVITSVLFGVEHSLWFAGILAGLAYGWLYLRRGNLWMSILAHGITNLLLGIWILATGNWRFW